MKLSEVRQLQSGDRLYWIGGYCPVTFVRVEETKKFKATLEDFMRMNPNDMKFRKSVEVVVTTLSGREVHLNPRSLSLK